MNSPCPPPQPQTGWGLPYGTAGTQFQASGGGFSHLFARPSYQSGLPAAGSGRGVPDVASDAAPHTGLALVISPGGDGYMIRGSGGASAAAPLWAGVIALADQYARRHLGFVNAAIYRIARTSNSAFHHITTGNNSASFPPHTIIGYQAGRGWAPSPAGAVRTQVSWFRSSLATRRRELSQHSGTTARVAFRPAAACIHAAITPRRTRPRTAQADRKLQPRYVSHLDRLLSTINT